jgi:hypothetical protein
MKTLAIGLALAALATPFAATAGPGRPFPAAGSALDPGSYGTRAFRPAFTAAFATKGWTTNDRDSALLVTFTYGEYFESALGFDSSFTGLSVAEAVARLRGVRGVQLTRSVPVTLGGARGLQFSVTVTGRYVLFRGSSEALGLGRGDRARFTVLKVGTRTVSIVATSSTKHDFDTFLPIADRVLASVRWR